MVIGLGRFGVSLVKTLYDMGHNVLAIDNDETAVQSVAAWTTHAVKADATDETVLDKMGVRDFDVAVVAMGSAIQSSVLVTIILKQLGVRYIVARADNKLHGAILQKIGVNKVVSVEEDMGIALAHRLVLSDVSDYVSLAANYGAVKLVAPNRFVGKSLSQLQFGWKGKWKVAVLLVKRGKEVIVAPELTEIIQPDDVMMLSGNDEDLEHALAGTGENDKGEPKGSTSAP